MNRVFGDSTRTLGALFLAMAVLGEAKAGSGLLQNNRVTTLEDSTKMTLRLGGCGGLYLLADPGELVVDLFKCDRNKRGPCIVRALFFAPDRTVLDDVWFPDDGRKRGATGPVQTVRFATTVKHSGVYGVMITSVGDRYGAEMRWSFRTNCPRYLVETSRGHRDSRHLEPIVLSNPAAPADVCFRPCRGACAIDLAQLPKAMTEVNLYDARGELLRRLEVKAGRASTVIEADTPRDALPWRLHLANAYASMEIDGVTRWKGRNADFANFSLWTPNIASWFDYHTNRHLLTPYSQTVCGNPGETGTLRFTVTNHSRATKAVALNLEFDGTRKAWAVLGKSRISVPARGSVVVSTDYVVPSGKGPHICRLRVRSGAFTTYSSIRVKNDGSLIDRPIPTPLLLKPFRHENEMFGYLPSYPTDNQMYFDGANRPYVASPRAVISRRNGAWARVGTATLAGETEKEPFSLRSTKIAFDGTDGVYTLGTVRRKPVLLHSADRGASFTAYAIETNGSFDIEQFSGHNTPDGPPPFVRFTRTRKDTKLRWRSLNDLCLYVPEKRADKIVVGAPILISRSCIGISNHSGIPSSIVSRGSKVHVVWGEATDPADKAPGVPTLAVTYDRKTHVLSKPVLVGYGPPANDVHNTPCITMDSKGFLHVLVGTHGRTFKYARSLKPNDTSGGWTEPQDVGNGLRQTYVGLVCDRDDTLHLVFRLWCSDRAVLPAGYYAALAYMSKRPGKPWSEAQPLVCAPFTDYSIFYHRLTIDRTGRLFLSYTYWSTYWFYRTDRSRDRVLILSPDGGKTWKLAASADLSGN